jgi:hypothetical protein
MTADTYAAMSGASGSVRPLPIPHASITPFDPNDSAGNVWTALPREQIIPPHFTDPAWLRADFSGVTLEGDYTPTASADIVANGGVTITTGRWKSLWIPFLVGANTTPPTMIMTPMLILYPRPVQDACLTEHAERAYDDMVTSPGGWNMAENGFTPTPDNILAWCRYTNSWGFRNALWYPDRPPDNGPDAMLQTLFDAGVVSFYCHGKEVDSVMTSEQFAASLQAMDAYVGGRVPIGVHFTACAEPTRKMGYPIGFPRDTFLQDWSPYDGRVHLCQQLNVEASAGLQGSSMWYARVHVNIGGGNISEAARGPGAPHSRVIAWEITATKKLYGQMDETAGCRRVWELLCGTRDDSRCLPVSGFSDGGRQPNGVGI